MPKSLRSSPSVVLEPVMASPVMRSFDRFLRAVAVKEVTVTFSGESGTGKEVMARRLHETSPRRSGPFVPINCAAIPEALFESELFGHERGAYTGANERSTGKIEVANGGTLFLDEIAEMPLSLQAKMLRFLESRRYMRVGGAKKIQADVRLVLATLRPLEEEVRAGRFRPDLYYRIQGIVLEVPPLRQRRRDIPPLLDAFIAQLSAIHDVEPPEFVRSARTALAAYDWPGNVRELRNVVELLCILREGKTVRAQDLPPQIRQGRADLAAHGDSMVVPTNRPLDEIIDLVIDAALSAERGNLTRAARRLKVSVRTLQRRAKR
ncbi:MAG: sigma-54-dependent Fis family transcriptional regulator [Kofleriaceae bacterium]|nr:sigma-54-dependent Fis family transcriptional regulator [Kofleriaceae bacterium]